LFVSIIDSNNTYMPLNRPKKVLSASASTLLDGEVISCMYLYIFKL